MIGIYKITSPTKKVYIGQSRDIEKRFKTYLKLRFNSQVKLYNSFLKYGANKHKFEILCECDINELNNKERYYQDIFSVIGGNGLNCQLINTSYQNGALSVETRAKMSIIRKGRKHTEETKRLIGINNTIRLFSEETKQKISNSLKGKKLCKERSDKSNLTRSKIILDTQNGIFYFGIKDAAKYNNIKHQSLGAMLRGTFKNNSNLVYI
jgi:group I intron endonuclease